jgi:phosphatidylserine decarboxylase
MAKSLIEWVETDVRPIENRPLKWISEEYFFRDPCRATFSDPDLFFSPADGVIIYQREVEPTACLVDIKGKPYSLQMAMQHEGFDKPCLVVGIFMTMYDVHVNRLPYSGFLSYRLLDPIATFNRPMLDFERSLIEDLVIDHNHGEYLHSNQRVLNRVYVPALQQYYYVLQIADYDVDRITPFDLRQNAWTGQNRRFSQIRFGSQVDLIIPLSRQYEFKTLLEVGTHVEAGVDPLVRVIRKA